MYSAATTRPGAACWQETPTSSSRCWIQIIPDPQYQMSWFPDKNISFYTGSVASRMQQERSLWDSEIHGLGVAVEMKLYHRRPMFFFDAHFRHDGEGDELCTGVGWPYPKPSRSFRLHHGVPG